MDQVNVNAFPSTRNEALALEYAKMKSTDTTTPEEFAELYRFAYLRIRDYFIEVRRGATP